MTGCDDRRIEQVRLRRLVVPLRQPYVLAFATLREFVCRIVEVMVDDGRVGLGEAVALPGYGDETDDEVAAALAAAAPGLRGLRVGDARQQAMTALAATPFARSALMTALELACEAVKLPERIAQPVVAPLDLGPPQAMNQRCEELRREGFTTLKVKVGRDVNAEAAEAAALLENLPPGLRVRFDANQGFDRGDAARFLASLESHVAKVELVEQPLPRAAWSDFASLAASSLVPLMLDESIYDRNDVERAAASGASWIKLKLCKQAGLHDLFDVAGDACRLGLKVVLGNGVASDVGNLAEAAAHALRPDLFSGAGEFNGFARLTRPLLAHSLVLQGGRACWETPSPDDPWRFSAPQ